MVLHFTHFTFTELQSLMLQLTCVLFHYRLVAFVFSRADRENLTALSRPCCLTRIDLLFSYRTHPVFVGLLAEADDVEVSSARRSKLVVSRLMVVLVVLLVVGVLVAVKMFVHVSAKTDDWTSLCIPTDNSTTQLSHVTLYHNVTLRPCNVSTTTRLPPTTWAAYVLV